jgi:hypothetical protein
MAIAIKPYTEEFIPAVRALNLRLASGGISPDFHFPESNIPLWLPKIENRRIYQECFLAVDGEFVRGGFIVKQQDFFLGGETRPLSFYRLPVSEGIVDRAYNSVGVHMLRSALQSHALMFALGMGGLDRPLPQMLKALGWTLTPVPFFFRVNRPARFLRNIAVLRSNPMRRVASSVAAGSGLGYIAILAVHWSRTRPTARKASAELISEFGSWADDLWQSCRADYTMVGSRDSETLNLLYGDDPKYLRIRVQRGSETVGWAVMLDTQMRENKYFGNMRIGTIADVFAAPEWASAVVRAAAQFLRKRGVDLIVSNQSHAAWCEALISAGFLSAPTNFFFASSHALSQILSPLPQTLQQIHLNRGDGDGPVNL